MKTTFFILVLLLCSVQLFGQDEIVISNKSDLLNKSIAEKFSIAEDPEGEITIDDIVEGKAELHFQPLTSPVANLDFTTSNYWVNFELYNEGDEPLKLVFETARPITNIVTLYEKSPMGYLVQKSGDAIPFDDKTEKSNRSSFRIYLPAKARKKFWLQMGSDGEIISLPMIFWEEAQHNYVRNNRTFFVGIFYGIFLFVAIIYFTFYVILRDLSFLFYVLYVISSGLLQFSLDGFAHQYFFPSGGYFTQHSVIVSAGLTVFFVLLYAGTYLKVRAYNRRWFLVFASFSGLVALITLLSLIPGVLYVISYPAINGMSLLSTLLVLIAAVTAGKERKVHPLFITGIVILILGAIIFILGNFSIINAPGLTQNSLKIATLIEILCLSIVMATKYKQLQEEKEEAQAKLLSQLEGINERLEVQVKERTAQIEHQKYEIEQQNKDILDSIKYAKRIQNAILPSDKKFKSLLPESFVFFRPRDIVSGDFYWIDSTMTTNSDPRQLIVYATADCTGHGVPGAFVSIIGNNFLNLGKTNREVNSPADALDFLNQGINKSFNEASNNEAIRDGMDIALCALDLDRMKLQYAGAKNPLYLLRAGELKIFKADKQPIGYMDLDLKSFTNHIIDLQKGDILYTFSDGFADQFGGESGKKYKYKHFQSFLISIAHLPMEEQKLRLSEEFERWKGSFEQLDDVLVIGVKI